MAALAAALGTAAVLAGNTSALADAPLSLEILGPTARPVRRPTPGAATLVGNSLSESRRKALAAALRALLATLAKQKNPFYVTLDDSEELESAEKLLADTVPLFTAAAALASGRWQSMEGDVVLRPVVRCPRAAHCIPVLDASPSDALGNRARFLAWPLGYAILLRAPSATAAARIADRLRAEPVASQVALVLTSAELHHARTSPALREVTALAATLARKQPDLDFVDLLKKLAAAGAASDPLPWLRLPAQVVLVVPRLGSLATADRFVAEVRTRLADEAVEWLAQPR